MTRLPAADPARRIGVLILNCGGPGCPAVGFLHEMGTMLSPEEIRNRFDLVGFDARGVGASGQLDCQPDYESWYALDPSPSDQIERAARLSGGRDFAARAANGAAELPFMNTENVTSDMERLRVALGDETISFLGLPYGTSLGARYADRYPERVRAFALDSGLPSFADPLAFVPEWVDGIERSFDAFLAGCGAATTCSCYSGGDPGAAFDQLMEDLDATPLEVSTPAGARQVGQHAVLDAVDETLSKPAMARFGVRARRRRERQWPAGPDPSIHLRWLIQVAGRRERQWPAGPDPGRSAQRTEFGRQPRTRQHGVSGRGLPGFFDYP